MNRNPAKTTFILSIYEMIFEGMVSQTEAIFQRLENLWPDQSSQKGKFSRGDFADR